MSVLVDAFPAPRRERAPAGSTSPPPPSVAMTPRMRLFSLARDGHAQVYNVMISPRCQGPAVIRDIFLSAPNAVYNIAKGVKIYVSENDGGGIVSTATLQNPSGTAIFEDMAFKYNGIPPPGSPFLHGYQQVYTLAGQRQPGTIITLDYPVDMPSFFVKVQMMNENQAFEGMLRVLEGVDLTRFF